MGSKTRFEAAGTYDTGPSENLMGGRLNHKLTVFNLSVDGSAEFHRESKRYHQDADGVAIR